MSLGGSRAVILALGAFAASLLTGAPAAEGQDPTGPASAEVVVPGMNDCLIADIDDAWDPLASVVIVDCAQVHNSQVFKVMPYPQPDVQPSALELRTMMDLRAACDQEQVLSWLGAPSSTSLPLRVTLMARLPTDKQWEAGARWAVCTASHPKPSNYGGETTGTLPDLFASTPRIDWVNCPREAPVSGRFSFPVGCTAESPWMYTGRFTVPGKVTKNYPRDLQAQANAMCAKASAAVAKSGARVKAVGALFPKNHVANRDPYAECFIPLADWNGRF